MKIREGFVRNAKNLNSGTASARKRVGSMGAIAFVRNAVTITIAAQRGGQRPIGRLSLMEKILSLKAVLLASRVKLL